MMIGDLFEIDTFNPKELPTRVVESLPIGQILQVMHPQYGHLNIPYDTNDPASVTNAVDEIMKKLRDGWSLYVWKEGEEQDSKPQRLNRDSTKIKRADVEQAMRDQLLMMMTDANAKKVLAPAMTGG